MMQCLADNGTFVPDKSADGKAGDRGVCLGGRTAAEFGGIPPRFTPVSLVDALILRFPLFDTIVTQ